MANEKNILFYITLIFCVLALSSLTGLGFSFKGVQREAKHLRALNAELNHAITSGESIRIELEENYRILETQYQQAQERVRHFERRIGVLERIVGFTEGDVGKLDGELDGIADTIQQVISNIESAVGGDREPGKEEKSDDLGIGYWGTGSFCWWLDSRPFGG